MLLQLYLNLKMHWKYELGFKNQQMQCKIGTFNPDLKTKNPRGLIIHDCKEKKLAKYWQVKYQFFRWYVYCDSTIHVEDARGRGNRLVHTRGIESIHICRLLASKHTMQYELMVVHSGINQTYFHSTRIPSEIFRVILTRLEVKHEQ